MVKLAEPQALTREALDEAIEYAKRHWFDDLRNPPVRIISPWQYEFETALANGATVYLATKRAELTLKRRHDRLMEELKREGPLVEFESAEDFFLTPFSFAGIDRTTKETE